MPITLEPSFFSFAVFPLDELGRACPAADPTRSWHRSSVRGREFDVGQSANESLHFDEHSAEIAYTCYLSETIEDASVCSNIHIVEITEIFCNCKQPLWCLTLNRVKVFYGFFQPDAGEINLDQASALTRVVLVQTMERYRRQALKTAELTLLDGNEGYVARIPGFHGLVATGASKKQALAELETGLVDWIDLALKRGMGLPAGESA